MDDQIRYHEVLPQNLQSQYNPNSQVEFIIDCPVGRSIELGSICLQGDYHVNETGATRATGKVKFDGLTGAHGLFSSFTTTMDNGGVMETLTNYPRYVRQKTETQMTPNDMFSAGKVCELCCADDTISIAYNNGLLISNDGQTNLIDDVDFNVKPDICINKTLTNLPQSSTGRINLVAILERTTGFIFGKTVDNNYNHYVKDLRLQFRSVPSLKTDLQQTKGKLQMFTVQSQKATISSNRSNISVSAPDIVSSVFCSFIEQAREYTPTFNNVNTSLIRNMESVRFLMNDSQSNNIVYEQTSYDEILKNYARTMSDGKHNSINQNVISDGNGFGVGQSMSGAVSLLNNKLDIEINSSSVLPSNQYTVFIFMNSIAMV